MPRWWFDNRPNRIQDEDDEETINQKLFNQRICADKKPYFFIYNYPTLYKEYQKYLATTNQHCKRKFNMSFEELESKQDKTEQEEEFLRYFHDNLPVNTETCITNEICWMFEEEFDSYLKEKVRNVEFDPSILKSDATYKEVERLKIERIYKDFQEKAKAYMAAPKVKYATDTTMLHKALSEQFMYDCYSVVNNEDVLCNIIIDLCYSNNNSKQFVWEVCSDVIVKNLLEKHDYKLSIPVMDSSGDIEYRGERFSMQEVQLEREGEDL